MPVKLIRILPGNPGFMTTSSETTNRSNESQIIFVTIRLTGKTINSTLFPILPENRKSIHTPSLLLYQWFSISQKGEEIGRFGIAKRITNLTDKQIA